MTSENKIVNGFCFMPPSLSAWLSKTIPEAPLSAYIWTRSRKPGPRRANSFDT